METGLVISIAVVILSAAVYLFIKSKKQISDASRVVWVIGASSGIGKGITPAASISGDPVRSSRKEGRTELAQRGKVEGGAAGNNKAHEQARIRVSHCACRC